jgi:segregation and condensation protein A
MAKDAAPEPLDPNFRLTLPKFEGPLDLLLHLVQQHELDILDLPIAFVTERYLEYLGLMQRLDLDVAAEYLVMAATLAHIKSKMLLPPDPNESTEEGEAGDELDPRAELIRRLLEYQKYKAAGEELAARGLAGRDVFVRGSEPEEASGDPPLAELPLFKLLDAFHAVLKRRGEEAAFQVIGEGIGIQERLSQLVELLMEKRTCRFDELFATDATVQDLVVTFLAILEMAKRRLARIYQPGALEPIHLEYRVLDDVEGVEPALPAAANDDDGVEPAIARPGEDPLGEAAEDALASDDEDDHDGRPRAIERGGGDGEEE